jgi:hypothetical protein
VKPDGHEGVTVTDRRIPISRVKNPIALKWLAALVASVGIIVYLTVTQPQNVIGTVFASAVLLLGLLLFVRAQWLAPESGVVGQSILWFWRSSLELAPDLPIALVDVGNGTLSLSLGHFPRRIFIQLLRLDVYDHASQEPAVLRLLAEQISRRIPSKREIADRLNRQADHIESGGRPDSSPLASLVVKHTINPLPGRVRRHD